MKRLKPRPTWSRAAAVACAVSSSAVPASSVAAVRKAVEGSALGGPHLTPRALREHSIRVLLISDVLLVRAALRRVLEADAIEVVAESTTCEEALVVAKHQRPDVTLIDLDSRAATFACVRDVVAEGVSGRVIALSDRAREADHALLVELGAMGTVLKSEPREVLLKAIRKVYAGEVWLDRAHTAAVLSRISRRRRVLDIEARKIAALTKREHEVIALVGDGLKNAAIGEQLFISESTVRNHLTSILDKLGVADRFELAVYMFKHGLVSYRTDDAAVLDDSLRL
jgi:two-component system, NarL family, nitrate/nitrite response regulator NarL